MEHLIKKSFLNNCATYAIVFFFHISAVHSSEITIIEHKLDKPLCRETITLVIPPIAFTIDDIDEEFKILGQELKLKEIDELYEDHDLYLTEPILKSQLITHPKAKIRLRPWRKEEVNKSEEEFLDFFISEHGRMLFANNADDFYDFEFQKFAAKIAYLEIMAGSSITEVPQYAQHFIIDSFVTGTLGVISFYVSESDPMSPEISIFLFKEYQNRGVAAEATQLLANELHKQLGVRKILARIHPNNKLSLNSMRRRGFKQVSNTESSLIKFEFEIHKPITFKPTSKKL